MGEIKLDGYCGLYCGGCDVFRLSEKARKAGGRAQWWEMPERLRKVLREDDVVCHGCKSDTLFSGCRRCPTRKCADKKGVESCALCARYPCFYFRIMDIFVRWRRLDKKLPHVTCRRPNLESIRRNGLESFLSEQERAWKCPGCGAPVSWYLEHCLSCGRGNEEHFGSGG